MIYLHYIHISGIKVHSQLVALVEQSFAVRSIGFGFVIQSAFNDLNLVHDYH